jgi:hypothetical protein
MDDQWADSIYLETDQQELLSWMVEAERSIPREHRHRFLLLVTGEGSFLMYPGVGERPSAHKADLETLADAGLLRRDFTRQGGPIYDITPHGRRYYELMKRCSREALAVVEDDVQRYLDAEAFTASYPDAHQRWRQAANKLWQADSIAQLTDIGHICREAIQAFAATLVERTGTVDAPSDRAKDVARIKAVLRARVTSETNREFLDALVAYWGTVSDLVQRQEHGAAKEGEVLTWKDARRVVFQTAIVMFEVDQAVR